MFVSSARVCGSLCKWVPGAGAGAGGVVVLVLVAVDVAGAVGVAVAVVVVVCAFSVSVLFVTPFCSSLQLFLMPTCWHASDACSHAVLAACS